MSLNPAPSANQNPNPAPRTNAPAIQLHPTATRLTPEQIAHIDKAVGFMRNEGTLTERLAKIKPSPDLDLEVTGTAFACRILDLLDANAALTARAEQAESDRDTLAAEVRAWRDWHAWEGALNRTTPFPAERIRKPLFDTPGVRDATDASGALDRAKGQA